MFSALIGLLLTLACISSATLALNEHEWRDNIVRAFGNLTKYVNRREFENYRELFADDAEMLLPGVQPAHKEELILEQEQFLKEYPVSHQYVSFVELLYNSPDVAMARVTEFADFIDGSDRTAVGLAFFIRVENDIRMKLGIFTME